jgi:hypothetical protein
MFLSTQVLSGEQAGRINQLFVRASDGLTYFTLKDTPPENRPACAKINYWMIKDENSNVGRMQYSLLFAAQASGKPIRVVGSNTCSRWSDGEDVDTIIFTTN